MKLLSSSVLLAVLGCSLGALAQGAGGGKAKIPQCQAPFAACQAAGYKVGAHHKGDKEGADNGLWVDCIDAVADGRKQVAGVDRIRGSDLQSGYQSHEARQVKGERRWQKKTSPFK